MNANEISETLNVLKAHFARYPLMRPVDAIKLLYQNEFGGGHMIKDAESSLNFIREEYEGLEVVKPENETFAEDIGNGLVRANLRGINKIGLTLEELNEIFVKSSNAHNGKKSVFLEKLEILKIMAKEGKAPFAYEELSAFLKEYISQGCPMVSHSDIYKCEYRPAYRVVLSALIKGIS